MTNVSFSPHIRHADNTRSIMLDVIISLLPASVAGMVYFGWRAAVLIAVCILSAVVSEAVWCKMLKKDIPIGDLSAVVTGLLLALNLPPTLPFWMAAVGSVVAIIVVKQMFGGLGQNFVNPAIAARIVLMVSFTQAMTSYASPLGGIVSSATPLSDPMIFTVKELFFGLHGGCIGETCSAALILGGVYLLFRRVISFHIPLSYIATVFLLTAITGGDPVRAVLSGGLLIGAIFMATDYVTTPSTWLGHLIFGFGCGIITFIIREFSSLPEGVSFAIILMNIITPHICTLEKKLCKPFGWEGKKK